MSVVTWLKGVFESKKEDTQRQKELKEINDQLIFAKSEPLTLGVEFELALMDRSTLKPAHKGPALVDEANQSYFHKEGLQHMVEVTTGVCGNAHDVEDQMGRNVRQLIELANKHDLLVTGTGRPPTIKLSDTLRVEDPRYNYQYESRKILSQRFGTLGTHVHIGMESQEKCIRYQNFYMHFLPHLIALAAGSPFEDGIDTGLASIRPTIAESLPVAGMPYSFHTWHEYVALCQAMFRAKSIRSLKDLWWDLRPSPKYGTLEIRVFDQFSNLGEALAVVAFVHALGLWFDHNQSWLEEMPRPSNWRLRENKWRAMRYGLDAQLVCNSTGDTVSIVDDIKKWLDRVRPQYATMDYEPYRETLLNMLAQGNSAKRQMAVWQESGSLDEVARFNVRELNNGKPLWQLIDTMKSEKQGSEAKKEPAKASPAPKEAAA
jgi:carboxylate-amine ligase